MVQHAIYLFIIIFHFTAVGTFPFPILSQHCSRNRCVSGVFVIFSLVIFRLDISYFLVLDLVLTFSLIKIKPTNWVVLGQARDLRILWRIFCIHYINVSSMIGIYVQYTFYIWVVLHYLHKIGGWWECRFQVNKCTFEHTKTIPPKKNVSKLEYIPK